MRVSSCFGKQVLQREPFRRLPTPGARVLRKPHKGQTSVIREASRTWPTELEIVQGHEEERPHRGSPLRLYAGQSARLAISSITLACSLDSTHTAEVSGPQLLPQSPFRIVGLDGAGVGKLQPVVPI